MTTNYLKILAQTIQENWDAPALTDFYLTEDGTAQDISRGNHYTYGEMYAEIVRMADYLVQLGIKQNDHIAICAANSSHWVIAYLAIAKIQGVSVTILHSLMPEQIAELVRFSDAKVLFTDEDIWAELQDQSMPQVHSVVSLADWKQLRSAGHQLITTPHVIDLCDVSFPQYTKDTLAMICFTSGTEGTPKGVMLSYGNMYPSIIFNIEVFSRFRNKPFLSIVPYAHLLGIVAEILQPLVIGIHVFVLRAFTFSTLLRVYQIVKPVFIVSVPTILHHIISMAQKIESNRNMIKQRVIELYGGDVEIIGIGGAILDKDDEQLIFELELPLIYGYGATECGPRISIFREFNFSKKGSSGLPLPNTQISIAPNGEILVKGDNVMLGYYKNPEATAQKIDADGWLHTGDRGYLDEDGYLYVEGRLEQDMIVLPNGENIHPDNIESKINVLPEVAESIVIARDGKLVAIVVVSGELSADSRKALRLSILRSVNAQLPMYAQIYDIEWSEEPLARTAKQTLKRYLYK